MSDYGTDLSCVDDLDPSMVEVGGDTTLLQALARRITTRRGGAIDAPNDGVDIRDWVSSDVSPARLKLIPAVITAELLKEERVLSVAVSVAFASASRTLTITAKGAGAAGPFRLVLAVSDVSVAILEA